MMLIAMALNMFDMRAAQASLQEFRNRRNEQPKTLQDFRNKRNKVSDELLAQVNKLIVQQKKDEAKHNSFREQRNTVIPPNVLDLLKNPDLYEFRSEDACKPVPVWQARMCRNRYRQPASNQIVCNALRTDFLETLNK